MKKLLTIILVLLIACAATGAIAAPPRIARTYGRMAYNSMSGKCVECGKMCDHTNKTPRQPRTEYDWVSATQHVKKTITEYYCNTCRLSTPVETTLSVEYENHANNGSGICTICNLPIEGNFSWSPDTGWKAMDGTLTIDGSGCIPDYADADSTPWAAYKGQIRRIVIGKNIAGIGDNAFAGIANTALRVDFLQDVKPTISASAFSGTTAVCRYYSNGAWATNDGLNWIRLPYFDETGNSTSSLHYDGGWYIMVRDAYNPSPANVYLTTDQAIEYTYANMSLNLEVMPAANDPVVAGRWNLAGWLSFGSQCTGSLELNLDATSVLGALEISSPNLQVTVNDARTPGTRPCRVLVYRGTLDYTGYVPELLAQGSNAGGAAGKPSVTITGDVGMLHYYAAGSEHPYDGDLTVSGTIIEGTIYEPATIDIPGIGLATVSGSSNKTFQNISQTTPIVLDGALNLTDANLQKISGEVLTLEDYDLEYNLSNNNPNQVSLNVRRKATKPGEFYYATGVDIFGTNPNFTVDDIYFSANTTIYIMYHAQVKQTANV